MGLTKGLLVAGTGKKWLLGCGLGCGIPLLLVILLTVGGGIVMMKPFSAAVDAQKELTAAHGDRGAYVPGADSLSPERLQAFMAVRRELVPLCTNFEEIGQKFEQMDNLGQGGEEPSKGEVFSATGDVMGAVFGIAGNIGRFSVVRNEALLAEGMGLGEYIWIYTLVYNSWLGKPANTDFESDEGRDYNAKEQAVIRQLMQNHAGALSAGGQTEEALVWQREAEHLERSVGPGVPWTDHELPVAISAAFEPYRQELTELYCAATAAFEFGTVRKRGLTFTSE